MSVISPTLSLGTHLPAGWGYQGCWTDYGRRKLSGPSYVDHENITQASCVTFCNDKSYPFAGVEFGQECYCGYVVGAGSELKDDTECDFTCPGASDEACGAGFRLNVFYNNLLNTAQVNPGPPGTSRVGCFTDDVYARALSTFQASEDGMTVARCTSSCKATGYTLAGVEFGRECFCGNSVDNNATTTDEGCDMVCTGDNAEFCGGADRLDLYLLNATTTAEPPGSISATQTCNPTSTAASGFLLANNGGFEQGLAGWTAAAYDPDRAPFNVRLTADALEGCSALSAIPNNGSNAQGQHFYAYTTIINLQSLSRYRLSLAIGHPEVVAPQGSDPKYTIRSGNFALGEGPVCGFKSFTCPLTGPNNSTWQVLNTTMTASSATEVLTIYLSWYNGNFDIPVYLDSVVVEPLSNDASTSVATLTQSSSSTETTLATGTIHADVGNPVSSAEASPSLTSEVPGVFAPSASAQPGDCGRSLPKDGRADDTKSEITTKSLPNPGFEKGMTNWIFTPEGGTFDISLANQSIDGCHAVSIRPTSPYNGTERSLIVQTRLTNLNSSHEWFKVSVFIGHANTNSTVDNGMSPSVRIGYRNEATSDVTRTRGLCGFARAPPFGKSRPCDYIGADGTVWGKDGMDTRLFVSSERETDATEMDVDLKFVWAKGASEVPILVDGMRLWEIEWGSVE